MIIGSKALSEEILGRPLGIDTDYIVTPAQMETLLKSFRETGATFYPVSGSKWVHRNKESIVEYEVAWPGSSAQMLLKIEGTNGLHDCVSVSGALALKLSHRYKKNSPHFHKTMSDIWALRNRVGGDLEGQYLDFIKLRERETYDYGHPRLNRNKQDFFSGDGVDYVFCHDDVHKAVAVDDIPAYTKYATDGQEVHSSRTKFYGHPSEVRLAGVYEEACVLAIERSVVPFGIDQHQAFLKALEKVCTSITSGFFREFAWENYHQVLKFKDEQPELYTTKFYRALARGEISAA